METISSFSTPPLASFFQATGAALAIGLSSLGAALATGSLGSQIVKFGEETQYRSHETQGFINGQNSGKTSAIRSMVYVVMAGALAIYGLIVGVIISSGRNLAVEAAMGIRKFCRVFLICSSIWCGPCCWYIVPRFRYWNVSCENQQQSIYLCHHHFDLHFPSIHRTLRTHHCCAPHLIQQ